MAFKKDFYLSELPKEGFLANGVYFIKKYFGKTWNVFVRSDDNSRYVQIAKGTNITPIEGKIGMVDVNTTSDPVVFKSLDSCESKLAKDVESEFVFKGEIDCDGDPNYPAAKEGDYWVVSGDGKIGGDSGDAVVEGEFIIADTDSAGGTKAEAGADFTISQSEPKNSWA